SLRERHAVSRLRRRVACMGASLDNRPSQEHVRAIRACPELGPDALLLNSREAPPEARHLGESEIVFAGSAAPLSNPRAGVNEPTVADLCDRVDEIRELLTR